MESSYMKIFRPWTANEEQDCTISTTSTSDETDNKETEIKESEPSDKPKINYHPDCLKSSAADDNNVKQLTDLTKEKLQKNDTLSDVTHIPSVSSDWYGMSSEALLLEAASLAHGLGHGHAAEEYARVLLGEEQRARFSAAQRKQRPKKYKCPHCDVGFSNNGQLKGHIRIHTGERPFRCDVSSCGKTFTRNEELTRHKRIHSGLRPFPCTECGKRFGRKDHLKKHARTHAQHRAAALYSAVPILPVLFPPSSHFADPWGYIPLPMSAHTLYGY